MHIDAVVNFPFPTPPDRTSLRKSEAVLTHLGALESSTGSSKGKYPSVQSSTVGGHITDLGCSMSLFPVSPRFAKMLVAGRQHGCLPYVIAIVSGLSVGDPFLRENALGEDPNDEGDADMAEMNPEIEHIRSEHIKGKEKSKLQRRAFFQIQQVRLVSLCLYLETHAIHRHTPHLETQPVTHSEHCQSLVLTSTKVVGPNSVQTILYALRLVAGSILRPVAEINRLDSGDGGDSQASRPNNQHRQFSLP